MDAKTKAMIASISSSFADWLVDWSFVLNFVSLTLLAATVILGGMTIIASKIDGDRKDTKLALLEGENIKAQKELVAEQIRRAQLVESVLWRNGIFMNSVWWRDRHNELMQRALLVNPDKPTIPDVPTIKVSIVCAKEREPMWVASDLVSSLRGSGFETTDISFADKDMRRGIVIECGGSTENDFGYAARDAIIAGLSNNFVAASGMPSLLPPNTLRILIGPSDRLEGPRVWQRGNEFGKNVPPRELPPPAWLKNEKGEQVEFNFESGKIEQPKGGIEDITTQSTK